MQPAPQTVSFNQSHSGQWQALTYTGILQIVIGAIAVALGIGLACVSTPLGYSPYGFLHITGYPIWCGVLFFLTAGILGLISGCKKSSHMAAGYLVASSFACLASVCVIGLSGTDLSFIVGYSSRSSYYQYSGC
ncbi:uncharacterized protein LOC119725170 [Patiria miniata]|uniref:Uncharacterized protein n=1 Tax=Patiria miniata TaxID=46514 RepID=A0A913ZKY2_PATMI|nr:uncharacterized protein LOC119725170 [Patiria miniata]